MEQLEQKSFLDEDGLKTVIDTVKDLVDDKVATATGSKVDSELSSTSTYPVQNKIVTEALNEKAKQSDLNFHINNSEIHMTPDDKSKLSNLTPAGESLGLIQSGGNLIIVNGIATVNGGNADTASSASNNSDFDFGDITNK